MTLVVMFSSQMTENEMHPSKVDRHLNEHLIFRDKHKLDLDVLKAKAAASVKADKLIRIHLIKEYSEMRSFYKYKEDVYNKLLIRSQLQMARFTSWLKIGNNDIPQTPLSEEVSCELQRHMRSHEVLSRHITSISDKGFHVRAPGGIEELDDSLHRIVTAQKFVCNATVAVLHSCHLVAEYRRLQNVAAGAKVAGVSEELAEEDITCPISFELFVDPVKASDGRTYERRDITQWLANNDTSPWTGLPLTDKRLRSDKQMRRRVIEFKNKANNPLS